MNKDEMIFLGNGPLAEFALEVLRQRFEVVFHARTKDDLARVLELKTEKPLLHGILASFGVMVPGAVLEAFESEGILNIHPSLLPAYRGASPIESAILDGANDFSVSVMKLAKAMDAGPLYHQTTLKGLPLEKTAIYRALAEAGAQWICDHIDHLPTPMPQDDAKASFCGKMDKTMSFLTPEMDTAEQTWRKIVAYQGYPKPKYSFCDINCIVLKAHILNPGETAPLELLCADGVKLAIDRLQPEGRKPMEAKAFLNGYGKAK